MRVDCGVNVTEEPGGNSRQFSNMSSLIFQPKTAAGAPPNRRHHHHHHNHRRVKTETCLGGGDWRSNFRDVVLCEYPGFSVRKQGTEKSRRSKSVVEHIDVAKAGPNRRKAETFAKEVDDRRRRRLLTQGCRGNATEPVISSAKPWLRDHRHGDESSKGDDTDLLWRWLRPLVRSSGGKNGSFREKISSQSKEEDVNVGVHTREATWKAVEIGRIHDQTHTTATTCFQLPNPDQHGRLSGNRILHESRARDHHVFPDMAPPLGFAPHPSTHSKFQSRHVVELAANVVMQSEYRDLDENLDDVVSCSQEAVSGPDRWKHQHHQQQQHAKLVNMRGVAAAELGLNLRVMRESKHVVNRLHSFKSGGEEQAGRAAAEVRFLARDNAAARVTLAVLGAIPPLVELLDSSFPFCAHSAILALLNLAIGNDLNKASIVIAGCVPKMVRLLQEPEPALQEAVVAGFLCLSALDRNKPVIGSSGVVPQLVKLLETGGDQTRRDTLRTLYNLSIAQCNINILVDAGAMAAIVSTLRHVPPTNAEKSLSVLSNMVAMAVGRQAVMDDEDALTSLIDILAWADRSTCQEKAVYVLLVISHYNHGHRQAMVQKRAIPALLELSLLGTLLAQKRAICVLECLREERESRGRPLSAPMRRTRKSKEENPHQADLHDAAASDGRKIVSIMVQQSLERNLQRIVRRANGHAAPHHALEFVPGSAKIKSLIGCSRSKSLPY